MNVSSSRQNPIRPIGSDVSLNCIVELSPAVDVQVTVNTVWTGPAGFMVTSIAQPVVGSNTSHASTVMVSSFGRDQSGSYNCRATVRLSYWSQFISGRGSNYGTMRVTIGVSTDVGTRYLRNKQTQDALTPCWLLNSKLAVV